MRLFVVFLLSCIARASVTVYSQVPLAKPTISVGADGNYTGAAAYDPAVLQAPPVPTGLPTQFNIQLAAQSSAVNGLSIPQSGAFMGFSIEFSVISYVCELAQRSYLTPSHSKYLQVPFLNLMALIRDRAGEVRIRIGGNSQETASLVDSLDDGKMIEKHEVILNDTTQTPSLVYTSEVFYTMGNISSLVNARWWLGIPLNDTSNLRLGIAEVGEQVLSPNNYLLGFQVGNEPDLYADHGNRPSGYGPQNYTNEVGIVIDAIDNDSQIQFRNNLVVPSISTTWSQQSVWDTGLVSTYDSEIGYLAVEYYPDNNCYAQYGIGSPRVPQDVFSDYLNHTSGQLIVASYLNSTAYAQQMGKPFLMFETNTASCGGFPGVSHSFGASLWALDYGMQMAYGNFSGALLHVGGQGVYYNPFTPPPGNLSGLAQWTIGSVFYSALVMAETLGHTGSAQVVDLNANNGSIYTPAYAIYENGAPARVLLLNYVTDPSGASDVSVAISTGGSVPSSMMVKYLVAPSVAEKFNITWAGQTFGGFFESDGRLQGAPSPSTAQCDTNANTCTVRVPAPGAALVFLNSGSAQQDALPTATQTYPTTAATKVLNTVTIDPSALATSNGGSEKNRQLASTSHGELNGGVVRRTVGWGIMLTGLGAGAWAVFWW
ncbi:glycoside hydrolase family 79 protein [Coniophora puteana RWD-64-598 SS2]|uniref:Glycoside hydrolase family 79 protein n=1 Tax=Coniophora puteana (strain RWD-64-598) TaxID=741705 RepID=A0A5M3MXG2_CONPW|nr:glycoside hydrolase family 79 protein [Coniophora puteana RWD-64-598 SS2]EIW83853.1 glycoside hydrolase family 79 protein [Coniophora puteana RWD-64-598 SS2]